MKSLFVNFIAFVVVVSSVSCNVKSKGISKDELNKMQKEQIMLQTDKAIPSDSYQTSDGELKITLVGHASLIFEYQGKIIHVDPFSNVADYSLLPKADLILLTHEHHDHLDPEAIDKIKKVDTRFIMSKVCNDQLGIGEIINNGEDKSFEDVLIHAVPAYNIVNKNPEGGYFHPKGRGNGYVLTFGDKKVYIAGDTENIPEMELLKSENIFIAFLPKNLPYTMNDDMFTDAVRKVLPTYLYPYHFSEFNKEKIEKALNDTNVKILVRPMSNK